MKYINYRIQSKTRYSVHSPFIYAFINELIRKKKIPPVADRIETVRRQLLQNNSVIQVDDLGAGSRTMEKSERTIAEIAKNSLMPPKYAQLLFRITENFKPKTIIEIGTSFGLTTMYLAAANPSAEIYTIEGSDAIREIAVRNFNAHGLSRIQSLKGNFDEVLPGLMKKINHADLVLIDGNHRKDPTIKYFNQVMEKSTNDTLIILDDIHWSDEMEEAWKIVQQSERVTATIDLFFLGIVFLRKELHKENFTIRF